MPGVGANLRDHFYLQMIYRCSQAVTVNDFANSWPQKIVGAAQYALFRSGRMAGNGIYCGAFARSDPRLERPDLQINAWPAGAPRNARAPGCARIRFPASP